MVRRREEPAFVNLLRAADIEFEDAAFESALAEALRSDSELVEQWDTWSGDQRWTPSAALDGVEVHWVPSGGGSEHLRVHPDSASAAADFIRRMAAWLAR